MATIKIEIDSDGEYCGDCKFLLDEYGYIAFCEAYNKNINEYKLKTDWHNKRCQQCLDAEINDTDSLT